MNLATTATIGSKRVLTISLGDALKAVVGFFWATENGGPTSATNPFVWAGRSYDFALRGYPDAWEAAVYASVGLNSGISAAAILRLLALVDAAVLAELAAFPPLWELDPSKLVSDPGDDSDEAKLWAYYHATTSLDQVGSAVSAKIAHHVAPRTYPLYDSNVDLFWRPKRMWHDFALNLQREEEWLTELERLVEHYRTVHQGARGMRLWRLRMVDVLTWLEAVGQLELAISKGAVLLNSKPGPATW
jgi:hypothetical protein